MWALDTWSETSLNDRGLKAPTVNGTSGEAKPLSDEFNSPTHIGRFDLLRSNNFA